MYYLLQSGIEPNICIGDMIYDGLNCDNVNIRLACFLFSSMIAEYYPNTFGEKLKEFYMNSDSWLHLFEVYIYYILLLFCFLLSSFYYLFIYLLEFR